MPWVSGGHLELGERPGGEAPSRLGGAWATQPLTREAGSAWLKLPGTGMGKGGPGT